MMTEPLVSVFLPTHSRYKGGLLKSAVESVLAQTYPKFEFFMIDDASSDGTAQYLQSVAREDARAIYVRHDQNVGLPAKTLAQAFLQSRGDYLAFIFDDNEWLPSHLADLLKQFEAKPDLDMVYGVVSMIYPSGTTTMLGSEEFDLAKLSKGNYIGNGGVVLRRRAIEQIGWYDPHIIVKRFCDWDLWLRIGKKLKVGNYPGIVALEKGATQLDSLGRSVSFFEDLLSSYLKTERDRLLAPHMVAGDQYDCFEERSWMNFQQKNDLHLLTFEHFMRTRKSEEALLIARKWMAHNNGSEVFHFDANSNDILIDAFNRYSGEVQKQCKPGCAASLQLYETNQAYSKLDESNAQLEERYVALKAHVKQNETTHLQEYHNLEGHFKNLERLHEDLVERNKILKKEFQQLKEQHEKEQNDAQGRLNESLSVQAEYAQLKGLHQGIVQSLSWKITRPLRVLNRLVKRNHQHDRLTNF